MVLEIMLLMFSNLIDVVLGAQHMITDEFHHFWKEWIRMKMRLTHLIDTARVIKLIHILRRLQLELYHWFNSKRRSMMPQPLSMVCILKEIVMVIFIVPMLPLQSFQEKAKKIGTIGSLLGPPLQPANERDEKGSFILNPHAKKGKAYKMIDRLQIREMIKGLQVPQNNDGQAMCIAYHCHDGCYMKCKCNKDHCKHSTDEEEQLIKFLKTALQQNKPKA